MTDIFARILDSIGCPQCGSTGCGHYRCRFSGITHSQFRQDRINRYAEQKMREETMCCWRPDQDVDCNGRPLKAGS